MEKKEIFSVVIFSNTVLPYCMHVERVIKFLGEESSKNGLLLELNKFPHFLNHEMLPRFKECAQEADLVLVTPINYDHEWFYYYGKERISKEEAVNSMKEIIKKIDNSFVIEVTNHLKNYSKTEGARIVTADNWNDSIIERTIKRIINSKKEP